MLLVLPKVVDVVASDRGVGNALLGIVNFEAALMNGIKHIDLFNFLGRAFVLLFGPGHRFLAIHFLGPIDDSCEVFLCYNGDPNWFGWVVFICGGLIVACLGLILFGLASSSFVLLQEISAEQWSKVMNAESITERLRGLIFASLAIVGLPAIVVGFLWLLFIIPPFLFGLVN